MWRLDTFLSGVRKCASGTICASLSWGGTSGGTAYGLQLEERKATGLDCFTMLHMSEVQQSSPACLAAFASGPMVFPLCPFLLPTSPFDPLTMSQHVTHAFPLELVLQHKLFLSLGTLPAAGIPSQG